MDLTVLVVTLVGEIPELSTLAECIRTQRPTHDCGGLYNLGAITSFLEHFFSPSRQVFVSVVSRSYTQVFWVRILKKHTSVISLKLTFRIP